MRPQFSALYESNSEAPKALGVINPSPSSPEEPGDDRIYMRWSLEDDRLLYEKTKDKKVELLDIQSLCGELKRGRSGILARMKHIKDPHHKAYHRLFGNKESTRLLEESMQEKKKKQNSLRPVKDIINKLLYDPSIDLNKFTVCYSDRFQGIVESPAGAPNLIIKGKERLLIRALPEHRIEAIKYQTRVGEL